MMGESIRSSSDQDDRWESLLSSSQQRQVEEFLESENQSRSYPKMISSGEESRENLYRDYIQNKHKGMCIWANYCIEIRRDISSRDSHNEISSIEKPKITPMIEMVSNDKSKSSSSGLQNPNQVYKYISSSSSKKKTTEFYMKTIEKENNPILIKDFQGRVLSEEPKTGEINKLTTIKRKLNFQKSALELNRKTKSSLYNNLVKGSLRKFGTVDSVRKMVGKKHFIKTHSSVPRLNLKKTKLSSLMNSQESWNPFRDNLLKNRKYVEKERNINDKTIKNEDISEDNTENINQNMSGSDYDNKHVVSKVYQESLSKPEIDFSKNRPTLSANSSRFNR